MLIRTDITAPDMVDNAPQRRLFYDDYVDIQLRGLQDGVLLRRGPVIIGGQEGVDIQFTGTIRSSGRRVVRYSRGLILDKVLYSFAFTPQDTLSPARASAAASSFFRGISVR